MKTSYTYGALPSFEDFARSWNNHEDPLDEIGFGFGNDPRVGTCSLSQYELWTELLKARAEFENGNEKAGEWCSSVLSILGFEWV